MKSKVQTVRSKFIQNYEQIAYGPHHWHRSMKRCDLRDDRSHSLHTSVLVRFFALLWQGKCSNIAQLHPPPCVVSSFASKRAKCGKDIDRCGFMVQWQRSIWPRDLENTEAHGLTVWQLCASDKFQVPCRD